MDGYILGFVGYEKESIVGKEFVKLFECDQGIRKCLTCHGKDKREYFKLVEIINGIPYEVRNKEIEKAMVELIDIMEGNNYE